MSGHEILLTTNRNLIKYRRFLNLQSMAKHFYLIKDLYSILKLHSAGEFSATIYLITKNKVLVKEEKPRGWRKEVRSRTKHDKLFERLQAVRNVARRNRGKELTSKILVAECNKILPKRFRMLSVHCLGSVIRSIKEEFDVKIITTSRAFNRTNYMIEEKGHD